MLSVKSLIFFNRYLSNEKTAFVDKSRIEPTIFLIEKISFSLKLFSGHFYGQSFIKTVRGPLLIYINNDLLIGIFCSNWEKCRHLLLGQGPYNGP